MKGDWASDARQERRDSRDRYEHENWSHLPDEYDPRYDADVNKGRIA